MVSNGAIGSTLLSTILLDTCTLVNQKRDGQNLTPDLESVN